MIDKSIYITWITVGFVILLLMASRAYYLTNSGYSSQFTEQQLTGSADQSDYISIASNLYLQSTYANNASSDPEMHATWRPPVWPFVISVLMRFTASPTGLLIGKVVVEATLIGLSLLLLSRRIKPVYLSLIGVAVVLEPQYLKYSATFLSEGLSASLLLLFTVLFIVMDKSQLKFIGLTVVGVLCILCHPVCVFYIFLVLAVALLYNGQVKPSLKLICIFTFIIALMAWPMRNLETFKSGLFLTASQGATFSKGWNENVVADFTNTQGDALNEELNLSYLGSGYHMNANVLEMSNTYKKATWKFIESQEPTALIEIALTKLRSNFNPFPETEKPGLLETVGSLARCFYLVGALGAIWALLFKKTRGTGFLVCTAILLVYVSQSMMATAIYTGLRFNSVYGLSLMLLSCLLFVHLTDSKSRTGPMKP